MYGVTEYPVIAAMPVPAALDTNAIETCPSPAVGVTEVIPAMPIVTELLLPEATLVPTAFIA
jgi:hypothetical protein